VCFEDCTHQYDDVKSFIEVSEDSTCFFDKETNQDVFIYEDTAFVKTGGSLGYYR
jgi:hypothetical protein